MQYVHWTSLDISCKELLQNVETSDWCSGHPPETPKTPTNRSHEAKADDNKYADGVVPKMDLVLRSRHNMDQHGMSLICHKMSTV